MLLPHKSTAYGYGLSSTAWAWAWACTCTALAFSYGLQCRIGCYARPCGGYRYR